MKNLKKLEEDVIYSLRELYHRYGYSQFKMRKFEPYDLYMQNKEFLVSDGVITFTDTDGTLMALKPDVTLSIVKNFRKENTALQKVCYNETVYRIAGAGHTYREIMQTGLECLGDVGLYEISEVVLLAAKSLALISDNFVLDISHMGVVSKILSSLQLSDAETSEALHLLGEKNSDSLTDMLGADRAGRILSLLNISCTLSEALDRLREQINNETFEKLKALSRVLDKAGFSDRIHLDFSIIGDRNYYNDFIFRGYVEGIPTAVLAGGQYDRLMDKMNKQARGVGFAVYLDQLELLDNRNDDYDLDTLLLYEDGTDLDALHDIASQLSACGVQLTKSVPTGTRYRRLMKFENGRLFTIEENG